jgi:hypothetical protein
MAGFSAAVLCSPLKNQPLIGDIKHQNLEYFWYDEYT